MVAHCTERTDAEAVVRHLHELVTCGPGDLDVAFAMSAYGYDEVKWFEGQGVLAELVNDDLSSEPNLAAAIGWYEEAVTVAREALAGQPKLLMKLGVATTVTEPS